MSAVRFLAACLIRLTWQATHIMADTMASITVNIMANMVKKVKSEE